MNLIIDIGNSRVKWAVFDQQQLVHTKISEEELSPENIDDFMTQYGVPQKVILSTVRPYPEKINDYLHRKVIRFVRLDHQTPVPIKNCYLTPRTLGLDRLAAAVGAIDRFPGHNLLIIDAGTAITFDVITASNEFLGGNISPGMTMRFQALHHYTRQLPLLQPSDELSLIGTTTSTAIINGIQNGILFEVETYINQLKEKFGQLKTIITGGDSKRIANHLNKNVYLDMNLTAKGLNRILNDQTFNDKA